MDEIAIPSPFPDFPEIILATILVFSILIYWRRRGTDRISYTRFELFSFLVVLVGSELAIYSGLSWISSFIGNNLFTINLILVFGLIAFFAFVISWGKSNKDSL